MTQTQPPQTPQPPAQTAMERLRELLKTIGRVLPSPLTLSRSEALAAETPVRMACDRIDGWALNIDLRRVREAVQADMEALALLDEVGREHQAQLDAAGITLRTLQVVNASRARRWHPGGIEEWSALEWAGAMAGEAGEACNAAKKLKRAETGLQNINHEAGRSLTDVEKARQQVGREVADTIIYGVLLAARVGVDIEATVADVFNRKSEEYGFPERLPALASAPSPAPPPAEAGPAVDEDARKFWDNLHAEASRMVARVLVMYGQNADPDKVERAAREIVAEWPFPWPPRQPAPPASPSVPAGGSGRPRWGIG